MQNSQNTYCILYLIRHGEAEANVKDIWGGDTPLTSKGQTQAQALMQEFATVPIDAIFSSDLLRARQTISGIAVQKNLPVTLVSAVRERTYGAAEGKTTQEYLAAVNHDPAKTAQLNQAWQELPTDDTEAIDQAVLRYVGGLQKIASACLGQTVLVATHAEVMRALLVSLGFADFAELPSGSIENTGWIKLRSDGKNFWVEATKGVKKRLPVG